MMNETKFKEEVARLDDILKEGRTAEVIKEVDSILKAGDLSEEQIEEFRALGMWGFYRQQDFNAVRKEGFLITDNERGLRCLAAMENYLGNLNEAKKYLDRMSDSPGKANTKMIGFRDEKDNTPREEVLALAFKWAGALVDRINTANLMNNTARWLFAKGSGEGDLMTAMGFMQSALILYGSGKVNLHHRAGASFWMSKIAERLFDSSALAIEVAEQSLTLWEMQLGLDPDNEHFKRNYQGAKDHLAELNKKIRTEERKGCGKELKKDTISVPVMTVTPYDALITTTSSPLGIDAMSLIIDATVAPMPIFTGGLRTKQNY